MELLTTSATSIAGVDLTTITTAVTSSIGSILPVGIAIFGTMTGIKLIPKLIRKFM